MIEFRLAEKKLGMHTYLSHLKLIINLTWQINCILYPYIHEM